MPSSVSWIEFSEADRRRTQDVLALLKETETRDELGVGVVRDLLADTLFPGTSTIQTRARYFLFIPWIYLRLAARGVEAREVTAKARRAELDLIKPLESGSDHEGVIGGSAGDALQRLPSAIYWAGLGVLGIRRVAASLTEYHRGFPAYHHDEPDAEATEGEVHRAPVSFWDRQLPEAPEGFPGEASLELSGKEAEYLQARIQGLGPTMLGHLVRRGTRVEVSDFPWLHPDADHVPPVVARPLEHARCFSEAIHGAALLYNLMLAEERKDEARQEGYRDELEAWAKLMKARGEAHATWRRTDLWVLAQERGVEPLPRTRKFIDTWLEAALSGAAGQLADAQYARELIRARERQIKRQRARLGNPAALARWSGASGTGRLDYRWGRVQAIVTDILRGLERA